MAQVGSTMIPANPEDQAAMARVIRRRRMADLLASKEPLPAGNMVGNRFVPTPWTMGLANALGDVAAMWQNKKADNEELGLARTRNDRFRTTLASMLGVQPQQDQGATSAMSQEGAPYAEFPEPSKKDLYGAAFQGMPMSQYQVDPATQSMGLRAPKVTVQGSPTTPATPNPNAALYAQILALHNAGASPDMLIGKMIENTLKSQEPYILPEGGKRMQGSTVVAENPKDRPPREVNGVLYNEDGIPYSGIERIQEGDREVSYRYTGFGKREKIAEGPKFNPSPLVQIDQKLTEIADPSSPTGVRLVRAGDAVGKPGLPSAGSKPTEFNLKSKGFYDRMTKGEEILTSMGDEGNPTAITSIAKKVPLIGGVMERSIMSDAQQKYRQAQEDWVRAKLRQESGAVIGETEMEREIATYFPQVGDREEVIKQKAAARQTAINAMRDSAGPTVGGTSTGLKWSVER